MRWLASLVFLALGAYLLYLFGDGVFVSEGTETSGADWWGTVLGPFWRLTPKASFILFGGIACLVFGLGNLCWGKSVPADLTDRWGWTPILQVAFSCNVLLAAVAVLALSVAARDAAPAATLGHIFLLAALFVGIGALLALLLLPRRKARALFVSTLMLHLLEIGLLTAVFLKGYEG